MRENAADLERLQTILDLSRTRAGAHLRRAFGESEIAAADLAGALSRIIEMHLAVVTPSGAPLVAPVDGVLFHGQLWFGLPGASVRARVIRSNPRVSASYSEGGTAFIVHGEARELDAHDPVAAEWDALTEELYVGVYGPAWIAWRDAQRQREAPGSGFTGWIEPHRLFAKAPAS